MEEYKYNNIRKSLIMAYKNCPRSAWYSVRDPDYGEYNEFNLDNRNLLLGQVFHKEMDKFYQGLEENKLIELSNIDSGLEKYFRDRFSPTTNKECIKYFSWYSKIEAERFIDLKNDGKPELMKRFIPLYIEKYIEYNDNGIVRNGHFDRLDYLGDNKVRLIEYKTGKSYDVTKSWKLSKLRFELYWYKEIIEHNEEFKDLELVDWMLINPTLEKVFITKFSALTKKAVDSTLEKMIVDINREKEAPRLLNPYCSNCKYKKECLLDLSKNIFETDN